MVRTLLLLAACNAPADPTIADEIGLTAPLGQARITSTDTEAGVTTHTFDPASGPVCMRGEPYRMATRPGASDDLVIYLQGGGACWSDFCFAVTKAPPGIPDVDLMRQDLPDLPVAGWDVAYLPYCDGSLFLGDAAIDEDGDGAPDRHHRGLKNLVASLELAQAQFPSPPRVLLAGSSGGGFGTVLAVALVRHLWPEAAITVFSDSGAGVIRGDDPSFLRGLLEEQGSIDLLPDDCADCIDRGHVTPLVDWWLRHDERTTVGLFSSWYDSVIARIFLRIPAEDFRDALHAETSTLHDAHPDRYLRLIADGTTHTTLLGNPVGIVGNDLGAVEIPAEALAALAGLSIGSLETGVVDGEPVKRWLGNLLDGDAPAEHLEAPGDVPWTLD